MRWDRLSQTKKYILGIRIPNCYVITSHFSLFNYFDQGIFCTNVNNLKTSSVLPNKKQLDLGIMSLDYFLHESDNQHYFES